MTRERPTIGLYGIGGVFNYGCEAIIRGTETLLRDKWPGVHIKYVSPRPADDKKRLNGCQVEVIPRTLKSFFSLGRFNGFAAHASGHYSRKFFQEDTGWLKDCDAVFSVGGDLYTIPSDFHYPSWKKYYNPLIHFGEYVKKQEKKMVIWGASIGPFDEFPHHKKEFLDHLRGVDLITSRETLTSRYLQENDFRNFIEQRDPAFEVSYQPSPKIEADQFLVGINFSPLYMHLNREVAPETLQKQVTIIEFITNEMDGQVSLIPHVLCDFKEIDDDLRYLKKLYSRLSSSCKKKVELIDYDPGFLGIKKVLAKCDVVLAARMHCAINAISLNVPTIFLSYSSKSWGMARYVYGNSKWVVNIKELNEHKVSNLIMDILKDRPVMKIDSDKKRLDEALDRLIS